MATSVTTEKPTLQGKFSTSLKARKQALVTFGATLAGFAVGVPVTLAFMVASAAPAATRVVQVSPASDTLSCSQPAATTGSSGSGGGQVLGATTTAPAAGGQGGGTQTPPPFVKHMLGANLTANGSITGPTGPDSTNTVTSNQTETVKVANDNDLTVTNSNYQDASSGSAEVDGNTTGGSATSGDAWNDNSASFNFAVKN